MAYKLAISSAIHRSDRILAVSRFTKKDILKNYPRIPQEKIIVTYEACDDYCFFNPKSASEILPRYGIIKPYVLYVGNAYPHKNPERLILAFKELERQKIDIKLVFVAGIDYFYQRLQKLVVDNDMKNVIFAGFVPDYDLDAVFRGALAYVRPSLYEGFELPPLEAMARGVPVLCSNHECAREILEDSVLYFDPENIDSMAAAVKKILADQNLRQELIDKGYRQVKKYSWKKMAEDTLNLYEKIF